MTNTYFIHADSTKKKYFDEYELLLGGKRQNDSKSDLKNVI